MINTYTLSSLASGSNETGLATTFVTPNTILTSMFTAPIVLGAFVDISAIIARVSRLTATDRASAVVEALPGSATIYFVVFATTLR